MTPTYICEHLYYRPPVHVTVISQICYHHTCLLSMIHSPWLLHTNMVLDWPALIILIACRVIEVACWNAHVLRNKLCKEQMINSIRISLEIFLE